MNQTLAPFIKPNYTPSDLQQIQALLIAHGTLEFKALDNGLFPAADLQSTTEYTGYSSIWLRDNIHIANAHAVIGKTEIAAKTVQTLLTYMKKQAHRFERMIDGETDPDNVMERPHVRFDGLTLSDIDQTWAHAQNDALGYFLWLYFELAAQGHIAPASADLQFMALFPLYFESLNYWQDEDSGHWEEVRKIEASSIGIVVAGLSRMKHYWQTHNLNAAHGYKNHSVTIELFDSLIASGAKASKEILPNECIQPQKARAHDGALLFLIYPANIVDTTTADLILKRTIEHLQGDHGVRRYIGDSFWCTDYKKKMSEAVRTADFSSDMSGRDSLLVAGQEAQWCIFDPIISTIYGHRYAAARHPEDLALQIKYLNRSLEQITGQSATIPSFRCPELYYVEEGQYAPGDCTPLLWSQANLMTALHAMEQSAGLTSANP